MGARQQRPVVVGIDETSAGEFVVRWAVEEARRRGGPLRLVSVYDASSTARTTYEVEGGLPRALLQNRLDDAVAYATGELGQDRVESRLVPGKPAHLLVEESEAADLVVVGSRARSPLGALVLGSVSGAVAAHALCSIAVVHPRAELARPCAVVGVDRTDEADVTLAAAFEVADGRGLALDVLHCWRPSVYVGRIPFDREVVADERAERDHWLTLLVATLSEKHPGVRVTSRLVEGGTGEELADRSETAALVVVGSRGHGAVPGLLLGSVSQHLLRHAHCTVLVAREHSR